MSADPNRPETWLRLLLDAVVGLQRRDEGPARAYFRFVEDQRGYAQAVAAWDRLHTYAEAWEPKECRERLRKLKEADP